MLRHLHEDDRLLRTVRTWGPGAGMALSFLVTLSVVLAPPLTAVVALSNNRALGHVRTCASTPDRGASVILDRWGPRRP